MEEIFQKFKKQFIEEILGLLELLEIDLLELEKTPGNGELIDSVFRGMHTIKGTSGMYGSMHISDFTHHLENIYQTIRDTHTEVDKNIIDISLASLDHIKHLLDDEDFSNATNMTKNQELLKQISEYTMPDGSDNISKHSLQSNSSKDIYRSWYIILRCDEQIYHRGVSLVNILSDLSTLGTFQIHRIAALKSVVVETWGILLVTKAQKRDLQEVFMFIEDYCSFVLLGEGDILNKVSSQNIIESQSPIPPKQRVEEDITIKRPAKLKTSLLVAEAAKQSLNRISVDSAKLDYLMYLVSELITLNSNLLQTTKDDYYEPIRPQIEQMEGLAKLFRSNALEIRLVPLGDLIIKFQRLVRDLSKQLDKKIDFVTHGTDTELDKNTIDLLAEPMIHIIRNCIDHGIESPQERLRKGKSENGTIKLSAHHIGNFIHIRIEDDGKGLDLELIREKAIQKGIIKPTDNLSKAELCNLIFLSGVSTSKSITNVSGRGVGMDVVKRKIIELRGEIQIDTEKDKGTSFLLKIQQSIAIIDTLLFRVQKTYFILPLTDIEICVHTDKSVLIDAQNTGAIEFDEKMIPFLDLRSHFNLGGTYPDKVRTLILKENGQYIGLLSDEILGEQQAVLKPLGQSFDSNSGIMAVSQHGNGEWAYMLNARYLHQTLKGLSKKENQNIIQ